MTADCPWLLDLGHPQRDLIGAYGAQANDRLCVFDLEQGQYLSGCRTISDDGNEQAPTPILSWQPKIQMTPATTQTIQISVTLTGESLDKEQLFARLYPENFPETTLITLTQTLTPTVYTATISLNGLAAAGYVHVWADENHDLVTDYALGGLPVFTPGETNALINEVEAARLRARASETGEKMSEQATLTVRRELVTHASFSPGSKWPSSLSPISRAFVLSSDGQVSLFAHEPKFAVGQYFSLQATTLTPPLPSWATMVGHAYYLAATADLKDSNQWRDTSINFGYFESDIRTEEEPNLALYFWNGNTWERLPIQIVDRVLNQVSAKLKGVGFYALFATISIPVHRGWNLIGYPTSAVTTPISTLLESLANTQTLKVVYGYDNTTPQAPWQAYVPHTPAWVSDLKELRPGHGYLLYLSSDSMTQTTYLRFRADPNPSTASITKTILSPLLGSPPAVLYTQEALGRQVSISNSVSMTVTAQINGTDCGQGRATEQDGIISYVVKVQASGLPGHSQCGIPGSAITLTLAGITTTTVVPNNSQWEALLDSQPITTPQILLQPDNALLTSTTPTTVTTMLTNVVVPEAHPPATSGAAEPLVAPNCHELLPDGSFERGGEWQLPVTDSSARIVIDPGASINHVLLLGLRPNDAVHRFWPISFSSAYQAISIPADVTSASLRFRYRIEHMVAHDHWRATLIDPATHLPVATFVHETEEQLAWKDNTFDLTSYRGRRLWLYFEVQNDGNDANGRTAVLLDDVSVQGCN